jgi:hypothetical protein
MSSKIVPNPLERLTLYLYNHYNDAIYCTRSERTRDMEANAFVLDQGGAKGGLFYRRFTCRGKKLRSCSAGFSHEEFLKLVQSQLGPGQMERIYDTLGWNPMSKTISTKTVSTLPHDDKPILSKFKH